MWCESCCDGTDLRAGGTCNVCGTSRQVVGRQKCEYPQTQADEEQGSLVTKIIRKIRSKK